jgi:hypothetical protein
MFVGGEIAELDSAVSAADVRKKKIRKKKKKSQIVNISIQKKKARPNQSQCAVVDRARQRTHEFILFMKIHANVEKNAKNWR